VISALQKVWSEGPVAMDGGPTKKKDPEKPRIIDESLVRRVGGACEKNKS
jgi:hypothetical protein